MQRSSSLTTPAAYSGMDCLLSPRSIAVIGASNDFNKLNGRVMRFLIEKGYRGALYPINPKYAEIGGYTCFPSVLDIGAVPDLVVISVPAAAAADQLDKAGQAGARAAIVFSSGFGEMGPKGQALERHLVETARHHGIRLCGPNTLGIINAFDGVYATFTQYGMGDTHPGPVGFVTQSGAFGTAIAALARRRGLGLGYFINTGNETDISLADCIDHVLRDERIETLAGYIEGISDGPGFVSVARDAQKLGKPMIVTKVGRTAAGARAAASHTGSLAGEDAVFDGIVRQFGAIRARNEEHMLDIVDLATGSAPPKGRGLGIITQSGGAGVLMSDRAEEVGLTVPALAPQTVSRLKQVLPPFGAVGNPVDVTAQFIADPSMLKESVKAVLADPEIHVAAIWLQLMDGFVEPLTETFRQIRDETDKPFVVAWVAAPEKGLQALRNLGICALRGAEPAIDAIAALVDWAEARPTASCSEPLSLPQPLTAPATGPVTSVDAAGMLADAGVPVAALELAESADEAVAAAERLGFPVALKIESADILHKTEIGGVDINLKDAAAVRTSFEKLMDRVARQVPHAHVSGVIVQQMASGTVELVIGTRRDPIFGPVVMVGIGGVFVEVVKDVVFHHAPVSEMAAGKMLDMLEGRAILHGVRGAPPIDKDALCRVIAALSRFAAANADWLDELDLNPVLAGPDGLVAVDCLMIASPGEAPAGAAMTPPTAS